VKSPAGAEVLASVKLPMIEVAGSNTPVLAVSAAAVVAVRVASLMMA
jgi:hypothetical protein